MASDAHKAYNSLAKYFGLLAKDSYLNALTDPAFKPPEAAEASSGKDKLLEELFSEGKEFQSIAAIEKMGLGVVGTDAVGESICITPSKSAWTGSGSGLSVLNGNRDPSDQGFGEEQDKLSYLDSFLDSDDCKNFISAIQVFPLNKGFDVGSTEISSLFLNSLRTLEINRAIPYLDIRTIREMTDNETNANNLLINHQLSLGKFLGARGSMDVNRSGFPDTESENDPMRAKFTLGPDGKKLSPGTIAGMEIFTTPQTLIGNPDNTGTYQRFSGGRTDQFRPFLSIIGFTVNDTSTGASTISYKTGELKLKLFDKGRLSEISDLVSPKRDSSLRFSITYGWSHPDGSHIGHPSDAEQNPRLGSLIDAMRVTEVYSVYNSSYTMNRDGTVDIDVKLSMAGSREMLNTSVSSLSSAAVDGELPGAVSMVELVKKLDAAGRTFRAASSPQGTVSISLPNFITSPNVSDLIGMPWKDAVKIKKILKKLQTSSGDSSVASACVSLIAMLGAGSGDTGSERQKIHTARQNMAKKFVETLKKTGDPFLRKAPDKGSGVSFSALGSPKQKANKGSKKYVSYGKVLISVMTSALSTSSTELQFVFGSFNPSAGGVYDYNIAQFPIPFEQLSAQLEVFLRTRMDINIHEFIKFLNDKFLTHRGMAAFGFEALYKSNQTSKDGNPVATNKIKKLIEKQSSDGGAAIELQERTTAACAAIYGKMKRANPVFNLPRINVHFITRPAAKMTSPDGTAADPAAKKITRVIIHDRAAGRMNTAAEALMSSFGKSYCTQDDYSSRSPKAFRGPNHNDFYNSVFKKLSEKEGDKPALITKISALTGEEGLPDVIIEKIGEIAAKEKKTWKKKSVYAANLKSFLDSLYLYTGANSNLRKFFFENSPYLAYGTEGSGIIEAALSAQNNDALSSIMLARQVSGGTADGPQGLSKAEPGLPTMVHPTTLTMTTMGCTHLRLFQKYFVDFGTNTTMDNYYIITGLSHNFGPGEYTSRLTLMPYDAYGRFAGVNRGLNDFLAQVIAGIVLKKIKGGGDAGSSKACREVFKKILAATP
jgi:hypothetical protein